MKTSPVITVIQPSIYRSWEVGAIGTPTKKRVAAYARVSTDMKEQLSSYEAQVEHYTKYIQSKSEWEFAGMYTDEGITATNTKKRDGFNRMIEDALNGKIDLILTKSVSRFARNTVDTLQTVRALKEKGVEVYFEKENIYTFDSKGELLITIMSSLAQEESRSISENVTWGQRKRMADGKVSLPYKRFLGYEKGADGTPQIVEAEAETIRLIYKLFLDGSSYREIADHLTAQGTLTPGGKETWSMSTVQSILRNEKYAGNAILQKKFTVDFLTKRQKVNEGEVPQYFVENSHPAIISVSTFELVQIEIERRKTFGRQYRNHRLYFGNIVCGACGEIFGPRVWHGGSKYQRVVWQCPSKYRGRHRKKCKTPHLSEDTIKSVFLSAWQQVLSDRDHYVADYEEKVKLLSDTVVFDKETAMLTAECTEASALVEECIAQNATSPQNQAEYQKRYDGLVEHYDIAKAKLDCLVGEKKKRILYKQKLQRFISTLCKAEPAVAAFSEELWRETVDTLTVHSMTDIVVRFHSGTEIRISVE